MKTLFTLTACLCLLGAAACDEETPDGGNPPGGCGFSGGGTDGTVAVTAGTPVTLDALDGKAQNTTDHAENVPLAAAARGALRWGACGTAGLLLWKRTKYLSKRDLLYVDPVKGGKPEVVETGATGAHNAALFFDAGCTAVMLRATSSGYEEHTRGAGGAWTKASVDLSKLGVKSVSHKAGLVSGDGTWHVFARTGDGVIHGKRAAKAGSAWNFTKLPALTATMRYAYHADAKGVYVLYRNTAYPCDPCNVDVHLATLKTGATSWTTEVVQAGKWGDPYDAFIEAGSIGTDSKGNFWVAAHFTRRVLTGSYKSTELRIYGRKDGAWCAEVIASANDGYVGTDGASFTGGDPYLALDSADRLHVVYRDLSVWHDSNGGQNTSRGQLRYAVRSGDTWTTATLIKQKGQAASAKPLHSMQALALAVSPRRKEAVGRGGRERLADRLQLQQQLPGRQLHRQGPHRQARHAVAPAASKQNKSNALFMEGGAP